MTAIPDERFILRTVRPEDAEEAAEVEQICFSPEEACSRNHMLSRITQAPELFLIAEDRMTQRIAATMNGIATEESHFRDAFFTDASHHIPNGKNVMLLGLAVLPEYRGLGLARALVSEYCRREQKKKRNALILTCSAEKVSMYQKFGFVDCGLSSSVWGEAVWHEMVCYLK